MNIDQRIAEIDRSLYELYRGGSTDRIKISQLWSALDRLEDYKREEIE